MPKPPVIPSNAPARMKNQLMMSTSIISVATRLFIFTSGMEVTLFDELEYGYHADEIY